VNRSRACARSPAPQGLQLRPPLASAKASNARAPRRPEAPHGRPARPRARNGDFRAKPAPLRPDSISAPQRSRQRISVST
jgi:hypothetical protein